MAQPVLTPEQAFKRRQVLAKEFITSEFWPLIEEHLKARIENAILELTSIEPTNDNLGQIAKAQERFHLAKGMLNKPYDLLGLPAPR